MAPRAIAIAATLPLAFAACSHDWDSLGPTSSSSSSASSSGHGGSQGGGSSNGGATSQGGASSNGGASASSGQGGASSSSAATSGGGGGAICDIGAFGACCDPDRCPGGQQCCEGASDLFCSPIDCGPERHFQCDDDGDCAGSHICCAHWMGGVPGRYGDVRCISGSCTPPVTTAFDGDYRVCDTTIGACPGGLTCTAEPLFGLHHGVCK